MYDNANFPKARKYWYNGTFRDWSEGSFHPMMHALHYGTSVFEGIRAYATPRGPAIFRLPEHIDRFLLSASVAKMVSPYSKDEIMRLIKQTVLENGLESCYIRPLLFYSYGNLGLVPKACPVELVIGAWEWAAYLGENLVLGPGKSARHPRCMLGIVDRDDLFDRAPRRALAEVARRQLGIDEEKPRPGVVEDVPDLVCIQSGVDRHEHRAGKRHPEVRLQ